MRIRELRAEARDALKGNLMKIALPLTFVLMVNYLLGFGFEFFAEQIIGVDPAMIMIATIIFYAIVIIFTTILQFGIIKRIIKVARNEESNFFADTFSGESIKVSFSILWGFVKKYAIWVILMILPIVSSTVFMVSAYELTPTPPTELNSISTSSDVYEFNDIEPRPLQSISTTATNVMSIVVWFTSVLSIIAVVAICVISYRYMLVYYLKHDYPDKPTKELFKKSRMMMKGNKAKALMVPFTMIGWLLLLMIGMLVVSVIFEIIWPSKIVFGTAISTMPVWATIIFTFFIYFLTSMLTSYINMTYYQLYMEQKPLELYNDDYIKPETNAKKYIWITIGVFAAILLIYFLLVYIIYMGSFAFFAYNM